MNGLKRALRALFDRLENLLERVFGPRLNPLPQLGTLGWFLFWIVAATGIYVYVFFDTGVTQAWESLDRLTREQWYLGGLMRSLHRYASDLLVVVVLVHALREFSLDRMRGNRWFPWVTGVPLLWFMFASGITGYWLVWDRLAQFVAVETTKWLDGIGIFSEPIARNFLDNDRVSGRFFTLMVYVHIAVPLLMLLAMWIHISRHAHARVNPPRPLAIATLVALVALSFAWPALSQPPADLDYVPFEFGFDWFYLAFYPLIPQIGGTTLWLVLVGGSVLLTMMPWLPPQRRPPVAQVDLGNCNGCARCFADCPFGAITMVRRTDGLPFDQEARVDAGLCMSCGICVGACPTATPFRRAEELVAGIELPERSMAGLREEVLAATATLTGPARVVVFRCHHDAGAQALADGQTAVLALPCAAMVPPPFFDLVLSRKHADGVLVSGCAAHDCYERLGDQWVEARLAAERDPKLRARVPRTRIGTHWGNAARHRSLRRALQDFRRHLQGLPPERTTATVAEPLWRPAPRGPRVPLRAAGQAASLAVVMAMVGYFATAPAYSYLPEGHGVLQLSVRHAGQPLKPCRRHTREELANLPFNQRTATTCERGRWPVRVEVDMDGKPLYRGTHAPAGLWNDGPSAAHASFRIPAGRHVIDARLRDDGRTGEFKFVARRTLELAPGENFVIEFSSFEGGFVFGRPAAAAAAEAQP
ncbi:MAG TPA: cytochrome b N-terminal domain-containing protein [Steroidobacteraceae bacterium]|nr:cytochrome b N-terminal domain-containing protein [Steroidobacteraceae bacterium]